MNNVALACMAHPDDAEFLCAGTLIRLMREHGWQVHIATMTPGDCGSVEYPPSEIARLRRNEGAAAADLIRATYHCVEERDLRVFFREESLERLVRLLAQVRPRLVLTHSPDDYHLDHEMTSRLVRAATFAAPIPNFLYGRWEYPPLEHVPHLYYCDPLDGKDVFGNLVPPGLLIDISPHMDLKTQMLACHATQRNWLLKHHGIDDYLVSMGDWGKKQGQRAGVEFAEGFRQHLGHGYPQDNLLIELVGGPPQPTRSAS